MSSKQAVEFLTARFVPDDIFSIRPTEIWTEGNQRKSRVDYTGCRWEQLGLPGADGQHHLMLGRVEAIVKLIVERSEAERTNVFVSAAPRFGHRHYEKSWQIRRIRALWADVDGVDDDEIKRRVDAAGLPPASMRVHSGGGGHLYWIFGQPYVIDDAPDPLPVSEVWEESPDGKRVRREYIQCPETGESLSLAAPQNVPAMSAKALLAEDAIAAIADLIGGDHVQNLDRILRLPGTLNRKDERNGRKPRPCELVEYDRGRLYDFSDFAKLAEASPTRQKRLQVASIPLPSRRKKTSQKTEDALVDRLADCASAPAGRRSEADYAYCCKCVEHGVSADDAWQRAGGVGKFAQRGRKYFDLTWMAAEQHTRQTTFERSRQSQAKRDADKAARESGEAESRPEIVVGVDEDRVVDEAIGSLADTPIYQRGGALVQVVRDADPPRGVSRPKDAPRIAVVKTARLREVMALAADWMKPGENPTPTHPPDWAVKAVEARGQWKSIRPLEGVTETPVMRADGTIVQQPGYDPTSGLLFEPKGAFPEIPENPSRSDAEQSAASLLSLVCDFPFAKPAHASAWLAGVLTPFTRYAYYGPAPLFLIDANAAGSGKSLLADLTASIVSGRDMARMTTPDSDEEFRKRITAIAIAGEPLILLDNVSNALGGPALDAALTATAWSDRILGKTELVCSVPLRATWYATGNNVVLLGDTARRSLHVRIESMAEKPEERTGFKIPDLLQYVRNHRPRLVRDSLTILRAYHVAGRPCLHLRPWGSFEAWSNLVRQAVVWCGLPDPGDTRQELSTVADLEAGALRQLIEGWEEIDPDGYGMAVGDVIKAIEEFERGHTTMPESYKKIQAAFAELAPPKEKGKSANARSVGMKLNKFRRRVVAGRCLDKKDSGEKGNTWFVARVAADTNDTTDTFTATPWEQKCIPNNTYLGDSELGSVRSVSSVRSTSDPNGSNGDGHHASEKKSEPDDGMNERDREALDEFLKS